jgi:membrane-associated protease RseP (regulator of RpoE activity)
MTRISRTSLGLGLALALAAAPATAQSKAPSASKPPSGASTSSGSFSFSFGTSRGRLGVDASSMTDELRGYFGAPRGSGVLVQKVQPGTPAAKAGVRVGDVLTRVEGHNVDSTGDVGRALSGKHSGDSVTLGVVRAHRTLQLTAKLDSDPNDDVDFDLNLDDLGDLFKAFGPNGQGHTWMKQWHFQWPPASGAPSTRSPSSPDMQKRYEQLKKRFKELMGT